MNYTLNQLQIFLKIAETNSITKAAEQLHLTQPAVSIQLKNFQMQFDIPLTEVIGRQLHVTDFGKEVAEAAKNILLQVEAINYRTSAYKNQLFGKLKIASVSTGKYVAPYFISDFLKKHTEVELILDVTNKQKVLESLYANEVDFALVSILPEDKQVHSLELLDNKLYLIGSEQSPDKLSRSELKNTPVILREKGSGTRFTSERFFESQEIPLNRRIELASNEGVKQAIIAGIGYSIMPLIGIKNELLNGSLKRIEFKGLPITTKWNLIWMKGKQFSPLSQAFLDYLTAHKDTITKERFDWYNAY